jgi:hypothetical protein
MASDHRREREAMQRQLNDLAEALRAAKFEIAVLEAAAETRKDGGALGVIGRALSIIGRALGIRSRAQRYQLRFRDQLTLR